MSIRSAYLVARAGILLTLCTVHAGCGKDPPLTQTRQFGISVERGGEVILIGEFAGTEDMDPEDVWRHYMADARNSKYWTFLGETDAFPSEDLQPMVVGHERFSLTSPEGRIVVDIGGGKRSMEEISLSRVVDPSEYYEPAWRLNVVELENASRVP